MGKLRKPTTKCSALFQSSTQLNEGADPFADRADLPGEGLQSETKIGVWM